MDIVRTITAALTATALLIVGGLLFQPLVGVRAPIEINQKLQTKVSPELLGQKISDAAREGRAEDIEMYAGIAERIGVPLPTAVITQLHRANGANATRLSVASTDLFAPDLHDVRNESTKMISGEAYSEVILGLSVLGVGVARQVIMEDEVRLTHESLALLKQAKRQRALTPEFSRIIGGQLRDTIDFRSYKRTLPSAPLDNADAARIALRTYTERDKKALPFVELESIDKLRKNVGHGGTISLLSLVKTGEDLETLAEISENYGEQTRGVVELLGASVLEQNPASNGFVDFLRINGVSLVCWALALVIILYGRRIVWRRSFGRHAYAST